MGIRFNPDICKIGHVIATRYDDFNLFSEAIYKRQLKAGYTKEQARYTHVGVLSGPYLVNIMPPRAKLEDIRERYKNTYVKFLRYKGMDFDTELRYKIGLIYNAISANLRYDWLGVASFILPGVGNFQKRPFCSEATLQAYQWFYPDCLKGLDPSSCMPAAFVASDEFVVFWEGCVNLPEVKNSP